MKNWILNKLVKYPRFKLGLRRIAVKLRLIDNSKTLQSIAGCAYKKSDRMLLDLSPRTAEIYVHLKMAINEKNKEKSDANYN